MHLVPLLNDPEVTVRANAIKSLYAHDLQKAASALRTMLGSKRAAERGAAMAIMPDVQDPPSMEEFLVAINTEQDRSVLAGGLDALDKITDPRLAKAVHRLMSHPNPALQMKAVRAYGRIAGTAGIKDLDRLYDETPSQDLKSTILNVLGGMCESGNISFLTKRLKESDERVVANAIEGLDRVGSIENSMLLESFLSHGSPRVRANAVVALFHTGNFKCLSVLTEMLSRPDANAHRSALHAMKQIHASLAWAEVQKRPLLLTPLNERPMNPTTSQSMALPRETERMRPPEEPRPIPRTTKRIAVDRSTAEERALVRAAQAMSDSDMKTAKDLVDRVIAAQPDSELAQFVLQRITAGTPENGPVPAELLEKSTFLPLLGEETRRAKASRSAKMLLESYFRIFERQLDVMRSVIAEGRDYLAKGSEAAAMEVAKFVVSQMQWTVDFDVRLGLVFYDKQDWERAFTHLMRAYIASGGEASLGVHLAAVAMKIRKRELAKALLGPILDSETTDPLIRGRAVQVAQAIAVLDNPDSEGTISS
jgi:HEAT repeat protein